MSISFTKEEIDSKIADYETQLASIQREIEIWNEIRKLIPEGDPPQ